MAELKVFPANTIPPSWDVRRVEVADGREQHHFAAKFASESDAWEYTSGKQVGPETLRDRFAMHERSEPAIDDSVKGAAAFLGIPTDDYVSAIHWPQVVAKWRYQMADAMLKARIR